MTRKGSVHVTPMGVRVIDVNIITSVPINVHETGTANVSISSSITLNIDITAQTLGALDIHETGTAQVNITTSITLNVNLSSSSITLNVNISSQTADINIDIKAQSVSVKLYQQWETEQGTALDIYGTSVCTTGVLTVLIGYTVPSGKTLYIYDWSGAIENGDGLIYGRLYNISTTSVVSVAGGNRGFQTPFSKPKKFTTGQQLWVYGRHDTGSDKILAVHIGGILI